MKVRALFGTARARSDWSARLITDGGGGMQWTGIELVIIAAIIAIFIALALGYYNEAQRPSFELKKGDWECTASHQESTTTYVNAGSGTNIVLLPVTTFHDVCDRLQRRAEAGR